MSAQVITLPKQEYKPVFVHSSLDDYGLDPYEFRLYSRIARREGGVNGACEESVPNMAAACGMGERKAQHALKLLTEAGLITAEERVGRSTLYRTTLASVWLSPEVLPEIRKRLSRTRAPGATPALGAPHPRTTCATPPAPGAHKGTPTEGTPIKDKPPTPLRPRKRDPIAQVERGFKLLWNLCKPQRSATLVDNAEVNKLVRVHFRRLGRAEFFGRCRKALLFVNADPWHTDTRPCPPMTLLRHLDSYAEQGIGLQQHASSRRDVKQSTRSYDENVSMEELLSGPLDGRWGRHD